MNEGLLCNSRVVNHIGNKHMFKRKGCKIFILYLSLSATGCQFPSVGETFGHQQASNYIEHYTENTQHTVP